MKDNEKKKRINNEILCDSVQKQEEKRQKKNDGLVLKVCGNVSTVMEDTYSVSEMHEDDSVPSRRNVPVQRDQQPL